MLLVSATVLAVQPDEVLSDPVLEARARELSAELRCVVCQNQSIDDSNAPLARDLRLLLRERLVAGDSDEAVKRFLVERYGTFVLLKPPFDGRTVLLWLTPLLVLGGAAVLVIRQLGRARALPRDASRELTRDEEERLRRLLAQDDGQPSPARESSTDP
ncbi:MAG: cytochrome c-type biogenesis protein CcmH [Hyphomicrobiaceae bacterium]|nr:cytochrome c-type biogenesis protein CcmH [Hyphomicrobiaceae bacterium]